ncbi:hypothetical protein CU098_012482 [Rhizopus stolonifer]|uniref:Fungal lipase-type domain-containing protein n=1 Tax=Rhizopus stolonifer TaxID=4846 RepID=A0A367KMN8_RHIST|nr:hypothetical protein CU098_012482 [Rhizopus stolonifer]
MLVYLPFIIFISLASCLRTAQVNDDPRWPVLYYSDEPYFELYNPKSPLSGYIEMAQGGVYLESNESYLLPATENMITFDQNSALAKEFMFVSSLCTTANCRESLDHWDCPKCPQLVPDGVVVRSFQTHPNEVTGYLASALDIRDIIATTIEDQLIIHPDYRVIVVGHSFGAAVASLVAVHLQLDFPDQLNRSNFKAYTIGESSFLGVL